MIFPYGQRETAYLRACDPYMREAIDRIGHIDREMMPDLFAALVNSIIGQQISMAAADRIWAKALEKYGKITPQSLAASTPEEIKAIGISLKKAQWIYSAASAVANGSFDISALQSLRDDEIKRQLCSLGGVGMWTAEMLMIFSLGRMNVLSYGDFGIKKGLQKLYRLDKIDKSAFAGFAEKYSPYGTVASFYLWEIARDK